MAADWWQDTFPQGQQTLVFSSDSGEQIQIAYGEKGEGSPLILVHGIGVWSYYWRHNIDALAQHYRVICFDARGHGFSSQSAAPDQPGHQVKELAHIIQALCVEPPVIVADSLGALTALALAQQQPTLVSKLVLVNVPIFANQLPSLGMRILATLPLSWIRAWEQLRIPKAIRPVSHQVMRLAQKEVMVHNATLTEADIYWSAYPYLELPGTLTQLAADLKLSRMELVRSHTQQPNLISEIRSGLGTISHPTLILWGANDPWFPVSHGKKLAQQLPQAQLQVIPNCGHQAAADCPAAFNQAVLTFLNP